MSGKLSLLDNSSDSEVELTINKDYANRYDQWRHKEELQKYKDLKKDEEDSESSSESEEESDEEFDEEFFRALSLLKSKDSRLYDKNFQLFQNKETVKKPKVGKKKPIYMKDYERNLVLERGGKLSDEDEEANIPEKIPTYDEEQENLKKSFKEALCSDDSDADDLLQVRTKTKKEEEAEEANYMKWLKGEEKEVPEDVMKDMSYLRNYWNDPKLDDGEKFLRDYILNKKYLEKGDSEIPTYEELTSGMLSDDEKMIEEQEKFEHKYNFRFEEPDEEFIKRYPRTVGDSLRRVDNRRKLKREDKAERKRRDREQRQEELKRLKALKRKEIEEKFLKLKEISGQDEINLNESDMESDFDPDKHDQKMREMFNDEYYQVEEEQFPEFPYDEELDSENWNAWSGEKIIEEGEEDEGTGEKEENSENNKSESTVNFKDDFANEMINASQTKKKVKKKSLFAKILSQPKPIYDPNGKSFEDYVDEYYKLDYEDIVGDMPVRYKYRKVIPNNFGLTVDEILAAEDRELNRWCSVKKTCQYRNDDEEWYDVQAFQKKAEIPSIKEKCLPSVYAVKNSGDSVSVDGEIYDRENMCDEEKNSFDNFSKQVDEQDSLQHHESEDIKSGVDETLNSSNNVNEHKIKSKKKKNQMNAMVSETKFDSPNLIKSNFTNLNATDLESSTFDDNKHEKKSKKKKKHNVLVSENVNDSLNLSKCSLSNLSTSNLQSSEYNDSKYEKKSKKKRKLSASISESKIDSFNLIESNYSDQNTSTLDSSINDDNKHEKKSKKKKREHNVSGLENEVDSLNLIKYNNSNLNTSHLNSSVCDDDDNDQNTVQSAESFKKSKKKKHKDKKNVSGAEINLNSSKNVVNDSTSVYSDADDSSVDKETSCKSAERRSKPGSLVSISDSILADGGDAASDALQLNSKQFNSNKIIDVNTGSVSETVSKKSRKKKKKKNKCKESNSVDTIQGNNKSKSFHKKYTDKYQKYASEDKRLGLSDERLAAYGINPKKFKNRIIYSKK